MLGNKAIEKVKVEWKHFGPKEATWEMVDQMWGLYPSLFAVGAKNFWFDVSYFYMCVCILPYILP